MAIKLYFKTLSSALLYEWEISGQISDGKYENAQPFGHWRWINDTEKIISKSCEPHYEGSNPFRGVKKYNITEWKRYMQTDGTRWAYRVFNYIFAGRCFKNTNESLTNLSNSYISSIFEKIPLNRIKHDGTAFEYTDFQNIVNEVYTEIQQLLKKKKENNSANTEYTKYLKTSLKQIDWLKTHFNEKSFEKFYEIPINSKEAWNLWNEEHKNACATINNYQTSNQ